jgi:hypothetical protein
LKYTTAPRERTADTAVLESAVVKMLRDERGTLLNMEESIQLYNRAEHLLPQTIKPYVESWLTDRHEELDRLSRGMTTLTDDGGKVTRKNTRNL